MSTTITAASGTPATTSPTLVLGYDTERVGQNIVHRLIGGEIAVVMYPATPRSGTLRLFYPDRTAAFASLNLHARATTFTITDTAMSQVAMTYVVDGAVTATLDEETRDAWVVSVAYQEIIP